ncbi:MAG: biopolymer transporter ExbD [Agriterribacter sp.]
MTRRHLFLLLTVIAFISSCNVVPGKPQKMTLVHSSADKPKHKKEDYEHSIDLTKDQAVLILDGKRDSISYSSLGESVKKNATKINTKNFLIIVNDEVDYNTIAKVLDLMSINNIKHFELVSSTDTLNTP